MSTTTSLEQIAQTFTGQLLQQADSGYDQARRVYNGLIDKRPASDRAVHRARPTRPTPSRWPAR